MSDHWDEYRSIRRPPRVIPMFSASSKAFALQGCRDIHPCRKCRGDGHVLLGETDRVEAYGPCLACQGTGVAEIPHNSSGYCTNCDRSGKDHLKVLQVSAEIRNAIIASKAAWRRSLGRSPAPEPTPEPTPEASAPESPRPETRAERRRRTFSPEKESS